MDKPTNPIEAALMRAKLPNELRPPICKRHQRECVRDEENCCWYCPKCRQNRGQVSRATMQDILDQVESLRAEAGRRLLLPEGDPDKWSPRQVMDFDALCEQLIQAERAKRIPVLSEKEISAQQHRGEPGIVDHQMEGRRWKPRTKGHPKGNWDMRGLKNPTERGI